MLRSKVTSVVGTKGEEGVGREEIVSFLFDHDFFSFCYF